MKIAMPRRRRPRRCHSVFSALAAVMLVWLVPATPAAAQSFDCTRARTPEEKAVCADPLLSVLDEIMADFYRRLRDYAERFDNAMGLQAQLVDEARDFLERRAQCGENRTCLKNVYRARIRQLLVWWQKAMAEDADGTTSTRVTDSATSDTNAPASPDRSTASTSRWGNICRRIGFEDVPEMTQMCPDLKDYAEYVETWSLGGGLLACAVPCVAAAYNVRYRIILIDPENPDNAMFIYFGTVSPNGKDRLMEEIVNPEYDPKTRTLRAFDRARGLGDCGMKWTWRWVGGVFELVEQLQKTKCDSKSGPWKRLWPRRQ